MKKIIEHAPEVAKSFFNLTETITQHSNSIDRKTKELILIGIFTAAGGYKGIGTHAQRALEAGATQEEIISSILFAIPVVGISKVNLSLEEVFKIQSKGDDYHAID